MQAKFFAKVVLNFLINYYATTIIATLNPQKEEERQPIQFPNLPYKWSLNVTAAFGCQAAYIETHKFLISSFHTGAIYNVCNWYSVGGGMDIFFNDAISKNTIRTLYSKHEGINYTFTDKLRVGISLDNEFKFGILTAIFDWGVYIYNPSRNYYTVYVEENGLTNRPLFYKSSDSDKEEAFHYFRFGLKCRVWDNIHLQATCKTHLEIAEFIEFGINYQIPFLSKEKRIEGNDMIFHYHKDWWKN